MAIIFDPINRLITIEAPATEVTIQELINAIRDWEDEQSSMSYPHVVEGSGKEDLGGGVKVGITLKLLNWRLKFADRTGPDWIVCNIRGGNLVAVDENGDTMYAIAPAEFVTVSLTGSSSATLQELEDIQYSSFEGCVHIDIIDGVPGTAYPNGTHRQPVNNLSDAKIIANYRGFNCLQILGNITFTSGQNIDGFEIEGENTLFSTITVNSGSSTNNTEFRDCSLLGTLNGTVSIYNCCVHDLIGLKGNVFNSALLGNITLSGNNTEIVHFYKCWSALVVVGLVEFDMNGDGPALGLRGHIGSVKIKNKTGSSKIVIDFISGRVNLDSTITSGNVLLRGVGFIGENLATGITLDTTGLVSSGMVSDEVWNELLSSHITSGTAGEALALMKKIETGRWKILNNQLIIYDDDGITPLKTFDLSGEQTKAYSERNPT